MSRRKKSKCHHWRVTKIVNTNAPQQQGAGSLHGGNGSVGDTAQTGQHSTGTRHRVFVAGKVIRRTEKNWRATASHCWHARTHAQIVRTKGLISEDRSNKATLLLTIPRSLFKSSA